MSLYPHEDQFLEEVFGLFALEAQEWITQCETALEKLEGQPPEDRQDQLYEAIICGVTNLGGSAATVELPALERLAFALIPLLQTMREIGPRSPREQCSALRAGLNEITLAVKHLEETKNDAIPGLDQILQRLSDAVHLPCVDDLTSHAITSAPSPQQTEEAEGIAPPPTPLLDALRDLDRRRSESKDQTRHIVDVVIKKAKGEWVEGQNGPHVEAATIVQILQELEARDERFLQELHERLPAIEEVLSALKSHHSDAGDSNVPVDIVLQEIHALHESARAIEAKAIMSFFHGLRTFLGIIARKGVLVLPQRIDAVVSRLRSILPMAQQWADIGKHDRASVQKLVQP